MSKTSRPYKPELLKALQDPIEAAEYLNAALEEDMNELFLLALRNVAEAYGMTRLAEDAQLNRESMYRMLSEKGNPQFTSLISILRQLGLKLSVQAKESVPV
ncbi:MAG: putative addiction module antidote protein [Gemmatimonadetes bacterium]|nr:putative addiction module antidote protein [Gemmatimonadota bacterium]MYF72932.1 putative addiction module antidote protein [Gemmatimonadota bacterium]MYK53999.1 putative addiction module antidote protein [Gemmatimonadota bacterium]